MPGEDGHPQRDQPRTDQRVHRVQTLLTTTYPQVITNNAGSTG